MNLSPVGAVWLVPPLIMAIGIGIGYVVRAVVSRAQSASDERRATRQLEDARADARHMAQEADIQARTVLLEAQERIKAEYARREEALAAVEKELDKRRDYFEERATFLEQREHQLSERWESLEQEHGRVARALHAADDARSDFLHKLEQAAGLTASEARKELRASVEREVKPEIDAWLARTVAQAREDAETRSRELVLSALQRYAAAQTSAASTSSIPLPNEEMKGRIIGKDGRNIKALENELGCTVLIDESAHSVTLSCFDPVRREIGRQTILRLIEDGRIHPARIEECAAAVRGEIAQLIHERGEEAFQTLGLALGPEPLTEAVGRLHFRHSYGQNILAHSVEVARLMGMLAPELGLDPAVARRVGLLHDIGKSLDHEELGAHAEIGADFLERQDEPAEVVAGVRGHHADALPSTGAHSAYAALASAADAITAARPGARQGAAQEYFERLEKLEALAQSLPGVARCFALHAGRELRVFVRPNEITDLAAVRLARDLAAQIARQMRFPGQIKVTVIRETRCVEFAR
ncbi:MAG: ribonuclease Y [Kiritimatiellae bacterium]|nr:ribonuclease Y [Kiritimatiellia bacterium]